MKILVIHASAGAGHLKAAKAIYEGLQKSASCEVFFADALDYTSPFFKKFYQRTYAILVTRLPRVWGCFFRLFDIGWLQPFWQTCRRTYNNFNATRLQIFLKKEAFDCIVTTHFMPNEVAGALKQKGAIRSRLITVVTDFDVHRIWLNPGTDMYAVASEWTSRKLECLGVPAQKIRVCGIPVGERFLLPVDRAALKQRLGLKEDIFTVLIATGSFGMGPLEEILRLLESEGDFQTIVVCGYNQRLRERLSRQNYRNAKILGLVDNMDELMAVADAMLTKPGGLSIAEALVSQLPMIFFHPIPGQETNNVRVLGEYGIGCMPEDLAGIAAELKRLKTSRDVHLTAVKQTQQLARPSAVRDIIALINE